MMELSKKAMNAKLSIIIILIGVMLNIVFLAMPVQAQQQNTFLGTLHAIIEDPQNFQGEATITYYLFSNNQLYALSYDDSIPKSFIGGSVQVQGTLTEGNILTTDITFLGSGDGGPITTGPQETIALLLKYNDLSSFEPQPLSYFTNFLFGSSSSVKDFWEENAYNALSIVDNGTYGWFILPQTQAQYNASSTGSVNLFGILNDAITVANNNGIQIQDNARVILFLNDWTGCCARGSLGGFPVNTPYGLRTISVSWIPIWGYTGNDALRVTSHEYGHNLEFPHSGNVYQTYESPWDVLSQGCNQEGAHTITTNKIDASWLTGNDVITIQSTQTLQTTIYPTTSTNGLRSIKITTPDPEIFFTIENRKMLGYDSCLPNEGIIIHKVNTSLGDWNAKPIDATPGDNDLSNAQWNLGQTYNDPEYQFNIQIIATQANNGIVIQMSQQGTPSSQCGTISSPGYYSLSNNVFSSGTCFTIDADNVVLDCQGNTITYGQSSQGYGVTAMNRNNIVVQNCFINQGAPIQYSNAINLNSVGSFQFLNNIVTTIGGDSIAIWDVSNSQNGNHNFMNNIISTSGAWSNGLNLIAGEDHTVSNNVISTTGFRSRGMEISTNNGNSISSNVIDTTGGSAAGIEIAASDTIVTENVISTNGLDSDGIIVCCYNPGDNSIYANEITTFGDISESIRFESGENIVFDNSIKTMSPGSSGINIGNVPNPNIIYNNIINTTGGLSVLFQGGNTNANIWNSIFQLGINIIGGPYLGGNFYAKTDGTGFSETCADNDLNGICDSQNQHNSQNIDYLPLATQPPITVTVQGSPNVGSEINISLSNAYNPSMYYILGMALATQPPIIIGPPYAQQNVTIPLTQDFVFSASVFNPSSIGLLNSQGFLNQEGKAVAMLQIPNIPSLAGTTVHFAFATFNLTTAIPQTIAASQSIPVTFLT